MKGKIDYHFKAINPTDFEITLHAEIENRLIMYIFQKSKARIVRTKNISMREGMSDINSIEIIPQYYKAVNTILSPIIKRITKETEQDGIVVIAHKVSKGMFTKTDENKKWRIKLILEGQYADKR